MGCTSSKLQQSTVVVAPAHSPCNIVVAKPFAEVQPIYSTQRVDAVTVPAAAQTGSAESSVAPANAKGASVQPPTETQEVQTTSQPTSHSPTDVAPISMLAPVDAPETDSNSASAHKSPEEQTFSYTTTANHPSAVAIGALTQENIKKHVFAPYEDDDTNNSSDDESSSNGSLAPHNDNNNSVNEDNSDSHSSSSASSSDSSDREGKEEQEKETEEDEPSKPPVNVFISYNMVEGQFIANLLYCAFNKKRGSIFLAEKRALNKPWKDYLFDALAVADVVVVICTSRYYNTPYTKLEFDDFVKHNKKIFIVEDAENANRLPDAPCVAGRVQLRKSQSWASFSSEQTKLDLGRCSVEGDQAAMGRLHAWAQATALTDELDLQTFGGIFSADCLKTNLQNSLVPVMFIDKEGVDTTQNVRELVKRLQLPYDIRTIAVLEQRNWDDYTIHKPTATPLKQCTLVCTKAEYFQTDLVLPKTGIETVKFHGELPALLKDVLGTDDIQIFFLPYEKVEDSSGVSVFDDNLFTSNYLRFVKAVLMHNYNGGHLG